MKRAIAAAFVACVATLPAVAADDRPRLVLQSGHSDAVWSIASAPSGALLATGGEDGTIALWEPSSGREVAGFRAHGVVGALAFSPDGMRLASGGGDAGGEAVVRVWDLGGREIAALRGHQQIVYGVAFTPDGSRLASCGLDGTVRLWDVAGGRQLQQLSLGVSVNDVAVSPDGRRLAAACDDGSIVIHDFVANETVARLTHSTAARPTVKSVAFSPDGRWLASGGSDMRVLLWDVSSGTPVHTFQSHQGAVYDVAFSRDGKWLASGSWDETIRIVDVATGRELQTLAVQGGGVLAGVRAIAFVEGRRTLAVAAGDNTAALLDLGTGESTRTFGGASYPVPQVAVSANGRWLAAAGGDWMFTTKEDKTISLWDLAAGQRAQSLIGHSDAVVALDFSQDGEWLASAGRNDEVRLWRVATGALDRTITIRVSALRFSRDGSRLAIGSADGSVQMLTMGEQKLVPLLAAQAANPIEDLAFGLGPELYVARSGVVDVYDVTTRRLLRSMPGSGEEKQLAISADGTRLAISVLGRGIDLVDARTLKPLRSVKLHWPGALAFSPDGTKLFAASGASVALIDVESGSILRTMEGHTDAVGSVVPVPRTDIIASGSRDGSIRLWSFARGEERLLLSSCLGTDDWVAVQPDGMFDGTPAGMQRLIVWHFGASGLAPLELFFNDFYHPGLLRDVLEGRRPSAPDIAAIDRRLAVVEMAFAGSLSNRDVTASRSVRVRIQVREGAPGAGARDVRLFRNGSLVRRWRGDALQAGGEIGLEAEIPIVAGENRLTAYAFNRHDVKSLDATLVVYGDETIRRKARVHVVTVGIDQYANPDYNLQYAVADAAAFAAGIAGGQKSGGSFERVLLYELRDAKATKQGIVAQLRAISAAVQPEDALFLYFASHGTAAGARFYLIPHDLGYDGPRDAVDAASLQQILSHSISDTDLETLFEPIDAAHIVLVIDACNSGQALEADEKRRGPMNSKGLAQLAWEKGMYVLAAAQGYQAALEATRLGHGLLTFALIEEGLMQLAADRDPADGRVAMREWLDYAAARVPRLQGEVMAEGRTRGRELAFVEGEHMVHELTRRSLQRPRIFYRREPEKEPFVVAREARETRPRPGIASVHPVRRRDALDEPTNAPGSGVKEY